MSLATRLVIDLSANRYWTAFTQNRHTFWPVRNVNHCSRTIKGLLLFFVPLPFCVPLPCWWNPPKLMIYWRDTMNLCLLLSCFTTPLRVFPVLGYTVFHGSPGTTACFQAFHFSLNTFITRNVSNPSPPSCSLISRHIIDFIILVLKCVR